MVLRFLPNPIPIFSPPPPPPLLHHSHCPTEIRFSRWNNANAAPFIHHQRQQQQIERDIRLNRRHESADRITSSPRPSNSPSENGNYRSHGTPSSPSSPSIPGKKSKYSKKPKRDPQSPRTPQSSDFSHPAFRRVHRSPPRGLLNEEEEKKSSSSVVKLGENGVSYVIENAPFEYRYSYTETPKAKPLGLREPPYLPFGPTTMNRPWTGRAPLPKSKKTLPEFDSFKPPPAGKKGVKPVQNPGPFLAGSGPKYGTKSREEVLGEPLTEVEAKDMVQACMKTTRQLNIGRDGLTHNMLDNIHAHWKRRRVCKIKCKGVCTVDMQNVIQQLEDKTGGKVIHNKGGVIFLFRGRNYNYMTRPRFPLMLWKPSPPIYPRLVQKVPEGLMLEEATEMRKRGRELPPICKLGKNGVYVNLVRNVMEAFEECELVRINCQGLNKSDVRKIGAKLQHLVPCVLISFEFEHILMWRGKDWTSTLPQSKDDDSFVVDGEDSAGPSLNDQSLVESTNPVPCSINYVYPEAPNEIPLLKEDDIKPNSTHFKMGSEDIQVCEDSIAAGSMATTNDRSDVSSTEENIHNPNDPPPQRQQKPYMDGVMLLLKQAIDNGSAVILDNNSLDANIVYDKAVDLAKTAPPGPIFKLQLKKKTKLKLARVQTEKIYLKDDQVEVVTVVKKASNEKNKEKQKKEYEGSFTEELPSVAPHGSLKVDELAKLLA